MLKPRSRRELQRNYHALSEVGLAVDQRDRLREVQINLTRERVEEAKCSSKPSLARSAAGVERPAWRPRRDICVNETLVDEIGRRRVVQIERLIERDSLQ